MDEHHPKNNHSWLIPGIILITGLIIRCFDIGSIPYTYDEFSALFRTKFDGFGELIQGGVMVDGHPAGIQVFLFYWTRLFGYTEWIVKLPFILAGVLSIWYTYKLGKAWFNITTAAFSAAFIATLEYTVMYSQIARPYISGLLFCLVMVWYWHKLVFYTEQKPIKNSILFVLFASLACYNHYFSLLFATMVGLSSIIFLNRKNYRYILVSGLAIILLFLPHMGIFIQQLSLGGVEQWLNKPTLSFFADYLFYIFHYSWILITVTSLVLIFCLFRRRPIFKGAFHKYVWLSLMWIIIPALAGYIYSVRVAAVLQFSVLIFSFPFLLFLIFSAVPRLSQRYTLILTVIIMMTSITTLVVGRQYYALFYKSAYEYPVVKTMELKMQGEKNTYSVLLHDDPRITQFYFDKHQCSFDYISTSSGLDQQKLICQLDSCETPLLIVSTLYSAPPELLQIVQEVFPYCIYAEDYYAGSFYVFSKTDSANAIEESMNCNYVIENTVTEVPQGTEWGPKLEVTLWELGSRSFDFIDIMAEVRFSNPSSEVLLVSSITLEDSTHDWRSTQAISRDSTGFFKIFLSVKLSDLSHQDPSMVLTTFLWNKSLTPLFVKNFCIRTRKGNPSIYGLYSPIPNNPIW